MASLSIPVQGTSIQISTTPQTALEPGTPPAFSTLDCTLRNMQWQGGTKTSTDVTTICSTAKEKRQGLRDAGTLSLSGFWLIGAPGHDALKASYDSDEDYLFVVTFVDGSIWRSLGHVTQRGWSAAVDGVVEASYSIELTGDTAEEEAP